MTDRTQPRSERVMPTSTWTPKQVRAARDLLGHYGHAEGWTPGGFTSALITTFERADILNRSKLLAAFPEFKPALTVAALTGLDDLADQIKKESAQ